MSISRRDLAIVLAGGAAGALARRASAETSAAEAAAAPLNHEAEAKVAWVLGKWGERFTEQQKKEIRDRIVGGQAGLEAMRAYPLPNDVEPATLFRVHRAPARPQRKAISHK